MRAIEALEWLFWQMGGLGPMAGQNHHFSAYAPKRSLTRSIATAMKTIACIGVLNKRLADRGYLGGDYSIADMACLSVDRSLGTARPEHRGFPASQALV